MRTPPTPPQPRMSEKNEDRVFVLAGSIELQTLVPPVMPESLFFKYVPPRPGSERSIHGDAPKVFQEVYLQSSWQMH